MDYVIRPLATADEPILWGMLYQALKTSEGAPSRDIVRQPEYARHVEGWGRAGDSGFVAYDAEQKDELLGASSGAAVSPSFCSPVGKRQTRAT